MHTLDITQFDANDLNRQSDTPTVLDPLRSKKIWTTGCVVLSVVVHLIVIALLLVSYHNNSELMVNNREQVPTLNSYLIIKPQVVPDAPPAPEDLPVPPVAVTPLPEAQSSVVTPTETRSDDNASVPNETILAEPPVPQAEPEVAPSPAVEPDLTDPKSVSENTPPQQSIMLNGTRSERTITTGPRSTSALRNYQAQRDSMAIQRMAQEQAKAFQEEKTSPEIDPPDLPTQEEREATLRKVEVDCSNLAKKSLGLVTGLMGGTVECREHADIQQYINKHLNKGVEEEQ